LDVSKPGTFLVSSEISADDRMLAEALAGAGKSEHLRNAIFEALRKAETDAADPTTFRDHVRWPLVLSLLREVKDHRVVLENGLAIDVSADSRIEQAFLLSSMTHPDHVWEPQTTRLLVALSGGVDHIVVGGAYIGDQVLPLARAASMRTPPGWIHAFEPLGWAFERLRHNLNLNSITNVVPQRVALWDRSNAALRIEGHSGLTSTVPVEVEQEAEQEQAGEVIASVTIDDYVHTQGLPSVGLIMLDTEGGEERALYGADDLLSRPLMEAPNLVFEIHRKFVDWTGGLPNTAIIRFLTTRGYSVFAVRDFQGNYPMSGHPIEIIPVDHVYLEGPPHGFNVMAIKDAGLVQRLGLRVVQGVSPKLLLHKDPALHHPIFSDSA
jgi:FkbM family methyltransferase